MTHTNTTACCTTWISWRGIFAGVVTALAISVVLGLLGISLGFSMVEPLEKDPMSGVGTAFGIWSLVSVLISLAAGGFMAGYVSQARGCTQGFLVWAAVLLIGTALTGQAISAATKAAGSALTTVGSGAASAASGAAKGAAGVASGIVSGIQENVNLDFNADALSKDVIAALQDTGIKTLQPQFLREQMRAARSELRTSVNQLMIEPENYEGTINAFVDAQKARLAAITEKIDRNAAVEALMKKRQITKPEAEAVVDNALAAYHQTVVHMEEALTEAQHHFAEAQDHLKELAEQAKVKADKLAAVASASAFMAAVALILGALASVGAGHFGSRVTSHYPYSNE